MYKIKEEPEDDEKEKNECFLEFVPVVKIEHQTITDADLRIRDIVARWPGSVHDSTIFQRCERRMLFETGRVPRGILLGDSAYPLKEYLLTLLLNPVTQAERNYNRSHIMTRNTVERQYGTWKRRFPILKLGIRSSLNTAMDIIVATAVLHNIAIDTRDEDPLQDVTLLDYMQNKRLEYFGDVPVPDFRGDGQGAEAYRRAIIHNHFAWRTFGLFLDLQLDDDDGVGMLIKKENEEISEFESRRSDSDMKNVFPHEDDYQIKREEDLVHTDNTCLVVHKKLKKEEEPRTRALGSENTNVAAENAKSSLCSNKSLNSGSELMHPDESYSHLESSSQNSSQMPNVSDGNGNSSCEICGLSISGTALLKNQTSEHSLSCDHCKKLFSNTKTLKRFIKSTEVGERSYLCALCSKSFRRISDLKSHMRTHTGERPFSCNVCNKSFSQRRTLQVHMQTHTGDRPFSCDICAKSFAHFNSLKRHLRGHHSQTDDRPFSNDKS
ncbi:hypothetical protein C0J52_09099 [Blattella germanica]|nr:hypothetical protein C0J52_09099 [Blattella germanica]